MHIEKINASLVDQCRHFMSKFCMIMATQEMLLSNKVQLGEDFSNRSGRACQTSPNVFFSVFCNHHLKAEKSIPKGSLRNSHFMNMYLKM